MVVNVFQSLGNNYSLFVAVRAADASWSASPGPVHANISSCKNIVLCLCFYWPSRLRSISFKGIILKNVFLISVFWYVFSRNCFMDQCAFKLSFPENELCFFIDKSFFEKHDKSFCQMNTNYVLFCSAIGPYEYIALNYE